MAAIASHLSITNTVVPDAGRQFLPTSQPQRNRLSVYAYGIDVHYEPGVCTVNSHMRFKKVFYENFSSFCKRTAVILNLYLFNKSLKLFTVGTLN